MPLSLFLLLTGKWKISLLNGGNWLLLQHGIGITGSVSIRTQKVSMIMQRIISLIYCASPIFVCLHFCCHIECSHLLRKKIGRTTTGRITTAGRKLGGLLVNPANEGACHLNGPYMR